MTKILKSALVALLAMCCCAMKAETIEYTTNGFTYSLDTETQEASLAKYSGEATKVTIPNFVTYEGKEYKVVRLESSCFWGNSCLLSIEIPESVTSMGMGCCSGCNLLESIVVNADNPKYDSREGCNAIIETESNTMIAGCKNTRIPKSVTSLGFGCFYECYSLTSIEIPSSVTNLGVYCFGSCNSLTSINIPSSVTSLGELCFAYCSSLESIEIPSSVTSLGNNSFNGCSSLESIVVDVANSKYDSREGCNAIIETESNIMIAGCKNTRIPTSVTSLGDNCFSDCFSLTSIEIPSSVTSLGNGCFYRCRSLASIKLPSSVICLGKNCFGSNYSLKSIVVDAANPIYDSRDDCNAIIETKSNTMVVGCQNTRIPSSVTSLGDRCFSYCFFTSVEIPSSVTSLGNYCFEGCSFKTVICRMENTIENESLFKWGTPISDATLYVPEAMLDIYKSTYPWSGFGTIRALTEIPVEYTTDDGFTYGLNMATQEASLDKYKYSGYASEAVIPEFVTYEGTKYKVTSLGDNCFSGCRYLTSIEIPSSVTSLGDYCFQDCSLLTSIEIPSSVTSLGSYCFQDCSSLTSIEIPSSVTSLGSYCFQACSSLTSIEIPSSVTSLGSYCFGGCSSLTSIEIPSSVIRLESGCFWGCSSLTSIEIPSSVIRLESGCFEGCYSMESIVVDATNPKYDSREGCNAIIETESNTMIAGCKNTRIPSTVTRLGNCCFSYCSSLTSIEIPSSVTSLGSCCFLYCSSLTSIEIPSSVTSLSNQCFQGCSLTSIEIPSSVISIGERCFCDCTSLTSIKIPSSVIKIDGNCFTSCPSLESIVVDAANSKYDSREGCNAIIETESNTMIAGCKNTRIPESVTSLGDNCFAGCSSPTSIEIPSSVTSLGWGCFQVCSSLESIEIPSSVTSLKSNCFWCCSSLKTVICKMENVIENESLFENTPIANAILYVPEAMLATYQSTSPWSGFGTILPLPAEWDNYLTLPGAEACKGYSVILPVDMRNYEAITGLQFELSLPTGVTLGECLLTDRRGADHTVSYSRLPNGNYQVLVFSMNNQTFLGSEGALLELSLEVDGDITSGDYPVIVKNIELATSDEEAINPDDVRATLTVTDVKPADANGDGKVSITDVVAIVNYILGKRTEGFHFAAADMDGNGKITITDVVAVVNKILKGGASAKERDTRVWLDPQ